ncbi:MAG: hypothetical protein BroJett025_07810 [Patescibacteria group bacterium]|nr:MAG: hypothetical protein BroJett025_07810 [Patescibacteria group bacterium]
MNKKQLTVISIILLLLAAFLAACDSNPDPAPKPPAQYFIPLPPPVNGQYPVTLNYHAGLGSQTSKMLSPFFELNYEETQGGAGGVASERLWHLPTDKVGVMQQVTWGDYLGGSLEVVEYYDANHCLVQGMVILEVKDVTLWQWLFRGVARTFDRGEVALVYEVTEPCASTLYLTDIQYGERWGTSAENILAMGATAVWENPMTVIAPEFHEWGFWETSRTPFDTVAVGLDSIRNTLQTGAETPDLFIVDTDSIKEIIGRQTGFHIFRSGVEIGTVQLTYRHTLGRGPNTNLIGTGSLSRLEYVFSDGRYYAWVFLTPQVSPEPSSLVLLVDSPETADAIEQSDNWVGLYPQIRNGQQPGVLLAVHLLGDLRKDTAPYSANVSGGEGGSVSGTIDVGTSGGIKYAVIGTPDHANVALAMSLLNGLGKSGLEAVGLYFPYKPGSGNGLHYYMSTLLIATAPEELLLDLPGLDIGVIDRVGFPDLEVFDGFAPAYLSEGN